MIHNQTNNKTFSQVFETDTKFIEDYRDSMLNKALLTDDDLSVVWAELYARHANDPIASTDEMKFKYQCFSILFNKGGKWKVALSKQNAIEQMTDDEITMQGKSTSNVSDNPSETVQGGTNNESGLTTLNNQAVRIDRMNKLSAYAGLIATLKDVTTDFIKEFDKLFCAFVNDPYMTYYGTPIE